jgi:hypothetical protein
VLNFSGIKSHTLSDIRFQATDSDGKTVVVRVAHTALEENGEGECLAMADQKYRNGQIENDDSVWVRSGDFT